MNVIPKKALIVYCPTIPHQPIASLDNIALHGCSGQIALEQTHHDSVTQLLGVETLSDQYVLSNSHPLSNESIKSAQQILQIQQAIVMVDLTGYQDNAYSLIDQLCQEQPNKPDTIYCIISPAPEISSPESGSHWWDAIVPRQSHVMKNGVQVAIQDKKLVFSYLHSGSCRHDNVQRYNGMDMIRYGSQNTILACHLMAEIKHKLGFIDKYGA